MKTDFKKVLIALKAASSGMAIASELNKKGFYSYTRECQFDKIVDSITLDLPDIVITDLIIDDSDAVSLINKTRHGLHLPDYIIIGDADNTFIERQVLSAGASAYIPDISNINKISEAVQIVDSKRQAVTTDPVMLVTETIRKLGVPAHILGYNYIRTAILSLINDSDLLNNITKQLYPLVASQYSSTPSCVERAIRHAIEIAWDKQTDEMTKMFMTSSNGNYLSRPSNSEFIALIADNLKLRFARLSIQTSNSKNLHSSAPL